MRTSYAIADYLPEEARRAAAFEDYGVLGRTVDGCCPLGVALLFLGAAKSTRAPSRLSVADALAATDFDRHGAVRKAAGEFIAEWDSGRLSPLDLPLALGVAS